MKIPTSSKLDDLRIAQIIDANLDRAREGLRVLEDWARFGLGEIQVVKKIKNFRQILGKHHLEFYKNARNFQKDKGIGISHPAQLKRKEANDIVSSNSARVQEALRVIEEFARLSHKELSLSASKIRYEIYTLETYLLSSNSYKSRKKILLDNNLYFITIPRKDLLKKIEFILEGGVKIIQYRAKSGNDLGNLKEAIKIKNLCKKNNALLIINDRIDIALACDADGVHLGQNDIDLKSARKVLGPSKIIGISANKAIDIKKALKNNCDYLGIGPIFKTSTKKDKIPIGIEKTKKLMEGISIPCFVIGGINNENLSILKENNIKRIAMVSGLINSENPKEEAIMIIKSLKNEN